MFLNDMQRFLFVQHLSSCKLKNKFDMRLLILSFFVMLLGYSLFFDQDDEVRLHQIDALSSELNSVTSESADTLLFYASQSFDMPTN